VLEILPYKKRDGEYVVRPVDDRGRGICRGAFGTAAGPLDADALAIAMPFRFHDRYEPGKNSYDHLYFQATAGAADAFWRRVTWDEELDTEYNDVVVLARVDGRPDWDGPVTNRRRGLFRFDDPKDANAIDVQGGSLELRVHFPYKKDAYAQGMWKGTAKLKSLRAIYVQPLRLRHREEVPE